MIEELEEEYKELKNQKIQDNEFIMENLSKPT